MTIYQALSYAHKELAAQDDAVALIYPLLAYCLSLSKEHIWAYPNNPITHEQFEHFSLLIARAKRGEPYAYLTGVKEFYGRSFFVTQNTLIPRPETESMVDILITYFSKFNKSQLNIVDVGTGSGNIAITLALELPESIIFAIDLSAEALEVARRNASKLGATNIRFLHGSLLEPLQGVAKPYSINAVVANLPYISDDEFDLLPENVKNFEPSLALRSGRDANSINQQLTAQVKPWLAPRGLVLYETTNGQIVEYKV